MEWARDNIAAFGGDPSCIAIVDHSAGFVADMLTYAWPHDPIVAGFILQSGVATTVPANAQNVTATSLKICLRYWDVSAMRMRLLVFERRIGKTV